MEDPGLDRVEHLGDQPEVGSGGGNGAVGRQLGGEGERREPPAHRVAELANPDGGGVVFSAERQGSPHLFSRRLNEDKDRELRPAARCFARQ